MNCPDCKAHNPDGAAFCSLCMRSFAAPVPASAPTPPTPPTAPTAQSPAGDAVLDGAPVPAAADERPPGHGSATKGRFRRTDEGFDWQCDRCQSWSPLELTSCHVCTRPFRAAMGQDTEDQIDTSVNPTVAVAFSAILPGSGHVMLGRGGTGWPRLVLFLIWFFGAIAFVGQARQSGTTALAAIPLFLGAAALGVVSVLDVQFLLQGSKRTALPNRGFLWLVIGVFVMTMMAMVPGVLKASGGATDAPATTDGPIIVEVDPSGNPVPTATDGAGPGDGATPDPLATPDPSSTP